MVKKKYIYGWNFYSGLIIICFYFLQILRWQIFPQFMDMYYHLLTAWGFIRAGGYSGWDFWQYAPVGRIHIYPPFFHVILATLIKLGFDKILLAKFFETITPVLLLMVIWYFMQKNYSERLAFFTLVMFSSSFAFFISLINHIPATLAMIFGILAFHQLFQNKLLRCVLLLVLCFYTHIGVSYLFIFSFVLYGLLNKQDRKTVLMISAIVFILSSPVIFKQLAGLKVISTAGIVERHFQEFKLLDYSLALSGLILAWRFSSKYRLFLSLFFASLIFLFYPNRFLYFEGYLAIIFLSGVSLDRLYERLKGKAKLVVIFLIFFIFFISPTLLSEGLFFKNLVLNISLERDFKNSNYKLYFFDSALTGMLFPQRDERVVSKTLWFPSVYLSMVDAIRQNSKEDDIIYSELHNIGVCLASISGRATANALLPEIKTSKEFDPFLASKIIIVSQDINRNQLNSIINRYKFVKIAENKMFIMYKNPLCTTNAVVRSSSVPFGVIFLIGFIFLGLFLNEKKLKKILTKPFL